MKKLETERTPGNRSVGDENQTIDLLLQAARNRLLREPDPYFGTPCIGFVRGSIPPQTDVPPRLEDEAERPLL